MTTTAGLARSARGDRIGEGVAEMNAPAPRGVRARPLQDVLSAAHVPGRTHTTKTGQPDGEPEARHLA